MRTIARGLVALFLILALGASVETRPPVAQASCCATPAFVSGSSSGFVTQHTYSTTSSTYAAAQPYPANGVAATIQYIPAGPGMTTRVGWTASTYGTYHVWTCQVSPHDCSGSLTVGPNSCTGCASYTPQDGQIRDDGPIHTPGLLGSQWFAQPEQVGGGDKGIGGGGSPCQCPTFYYQVFVNGVPYCKTALPPFNEFPC